MAENSKIEWTHHTFNPVRGCTKVDAGCAHCYAETLSKRNPKVLGEWGPDGMRAIAAEAYWREPIRWNADAQAAGERRRVFCASLSDVFEDHPAWVEPRKRLFKLIDETPWLDWLLLTKRPENVERLSPDFCMPNVWLGTSISDQASAVKRIPVLLGLGHLFAVTFLSIEPLVSEIRLSTICGLTLNRDGKHRPLQNGGQIDWVIVGGESGPGARPMHPDWVRSIRDECVKADVPFFFKQWGEWLPIDHGADAKDGQLATFTKQIPSGTAVDKCVVNVGKKRAGRLLDGREWNEMPTVERSLV